MRILVVDDDPELGELVAKSLSRDGHVLTNAADLEGAREALAEAFDLIVLDLGLPDGSGLELCRELRARGDSVPVLVLTAQSAVNERVDGLNAGADDYLTKPFALAELRARVQALGRRRGETAAPCVDVGGVSLDFSRRRASRDDLEVELTSKEWSILEALSNRRGRIVNRDVLLDELWGESTESAGASLEVLIGRIRRKLGKGVIRTARGQGYALE